jgi:hypothetical protein
MASSKNRAKRQAQKRQRDYLHKLNELRKVGAYEPTDETLTPYRKSRINKLWRELGDKIEPGPHARAKWFFVGTDKLTGPERKHFLENARSLDIATTKRGVFLQREGQRRARLAYNRENDEYDIVLTGKVKWGENKGKRISDRIPIGPVDRIGRELERIENVASKFGKLKKGEAISFVVIEQGEEVGASQSTFTDAKRLRDYIDTRYHRDNKAAKLKFLRMIRVRKSTLTQWQQEHPPKARRMARRGKTPKGYNPH